MAGSGTTFHAATRTTDGSGEIIRGRLLTREEAETERQAGGDVVVCGPDELTNRLEAADIEAAVGPWKHQTPHLLTAGPQALPHFQQRRKPPGGHTYYETTTRKAR
jgi:hypothetical protein